MNLTIHEIVNKADQAWNDGLDFLAHHHYQEAVNMLQEQSGNDVLLSPTDAESIAHAFAMLALFEKDEGNFQVAFDYYSKGISHLEIIFGTNHRSTIFFYSLQTSCLREMGDLVKAEEIARDTLSKAEVALGPRHRYLGDAMFSLAEILWDKGNKVDAEIYLRASINHDLELHGKNSGFYALGLMTLAEWLESTGRLQEAFATIQLARELVESNDIFNEEGKAALIDRHALIVEKLSRTH